jgi:hypothetical protein
MTTPDLFATPVMIKRAWISPCGRYRYTLERIWDEKTPPLVFVMLNPSTADADLDDPTIRRCMGFGRREGAGGIFVVNLYAFRATDPATLWTVDDPIGPLNHHAHAIAVVRPHRGPVICAWGANAKEDAWTKFVWASELRGHRLACLGKTKDGAPRHPLYLANSAALEDFP